MGGAGGDGDQAQVQQSEAVAATAAQHAAAAARALVAHSDLSATEIVRSSLEIASQIDVYTNEQIVIEEMEAVG